MTWSETRVVESHGLELQITVTEKVFDFDAGELDELAGVMLNMRLQDVHGAGRRALSELLMEFKGQVELPEPDRRTADEKARDRIAAGVGSLADYNFTGIRLPVNAGGDKPVWG